MNISPLLASAVAGFACCAISTGAIAQTWSPAIEKEALRQALQQNTSCNAACATNLAHVIVDQTVDEGLDLVATLKTAAKAPRALQLALLYALMRRSAERGEKIVSSHGACSTSCDQLNSDVVALARAGALGPMLKDGKIDPATFQDQRVLNIYLKYVKPLDTDKLPWQFQNDDWWKKISATS
jgi:hypothetical protein